MTLHRRAVLSASVVLSTLMLPKRSTARQKPSIVGTWDLLSLYDETDGDEVDTFGADPKGRLALDRAGFFSCVILTSTPLISPRTNQRTGPVTPETVGPGMVAYYGKYIVDEARTISFHVENGLTDGWTRDPREAAFDLDHDTMSLVSSYRSLTGSDYSHLRWRRLCD